VAKFGINKKKGWGGGDDNCTLHKIVITIVLYCKCVVVGVDTVGSKTKLHVGQQKV